MSPHGREQDRVPDQPSTRHHEDRFENRNTGRALWTGV
jgi:hypothetical protein